MLAPEKMTFYCRQKNTDGIYHAFPVDSKGSHEVAKSWATNGGKSWGGSGWVYKTKDGQDVISFEFENKGFKDLTITELDYRGNGGRAYQAILEHEGNKFKIDLREKTLMDVILLKGIEAGGKLNGTFCFVKEAAQTNIILEGTKEHEAAVAEREKRETFTKKISNKDLKPGYAYETVTGKSAIFLGFVYTQSLDQYRYDLAKPHKAMLFANCSGEIKSFLSTGEKQQYGLYSWTFNVVKSHSYKIEKDKVLDVPLSDALQHINKYFQEQYEEVVERKHWSSDITDFFSIYELANIKENKKDVDFKAEDVKVMRIKSDRRYW